MTPTAPDTTGMTVLDLAQAGRFEEIHDLFAPPLRAMVPAEALHAAWAAEIAQRGPVTAVGEPVSEPGRAGGRAGEDPGVVRAGRGDRGHIARRRGLAHRHPATQTRRRSTSRT